MKKVDIRGYFNNKAFQRNRSDKKLSLTPLGSGFPVPNATTFNKSNYDIYYLNERDNFECTGDIIPMKLEKSITSIGIIALGVNGDYHETIILEEEKGVRHCEVVFPFMHRTYLLNQREKVFYTSKYLISQNSKDGIVKQGISLFEIKIKFEHAIRIKYLKFPDNICIHVFAITLF